VPLALGLRSGHVVQKLLSGGWAVE
jgi:hypothetical protein